MLPKRPLVRRRRRNHRAIQFLPSVQGLESRQLLTGVPTGVSDAYTVIHDQVLVSSSYGSVLDNDTDPDGDALTAALAANPSHGAISFYADGTFTYTPATHFVGVDTFTYRASDGTNTSNTATVTISVTNQAPVGANDVNTVIHDQVLDSSLYGSVLGNDTDADGDLLTAAISTQPAHGTVSLTADGFFVYTPAAYFAGIDSFTYKATDGVAITGARTVTITVTNQAPVGANDVYTVIHDHAFDSSGYGGVLYNDTDADGDPLTAMLVTNPTHGTLSLNVDGYFVYTPAAHYVGSDSFTYKATDGVAITGARNVTITITNQAPVGLNDAYTVIHDHAFDSSGYGGVLDNDTDADGDPLTAVLVTNPTHGTVNLGGDGYFTYTPAAHFAGIDSFTYRATDGVATAATKTVTISVTNHAPAGANDVYTVIHDQIIDPTHYGSVLDNDTDADGDPLTAVLVTNPAHGTVSLDADGYFTYTPAAHYVGTDSFSYRATDGVALTGARMVSITVTNQAPVAMDDSYSILHDEIIDGSWLISLLDNDTDADNDALTAAVSTQPSHGTLSLNSDGTFVYTPAFHYVGNDFFTYRATDGAASSNVATVSISMAQTIPDAPNLVATVVSASVVNLSWSDVWNATAYTLERSSDGWLSWVQIATLGAGATSYQDTGLLDGSDYSYDVFATNALGDSGYSEPASATTRFYTPSVATAASADPDPITGKTTNLSVLGSVQGGESKLHYTWAVSTKPSGAPNPTFAQNGTNAAKNTTVTFAMAGTYTFVVTIANETSTTTSDVSVTVQQTATKLSISRGADTITNGATRQIAASENDQFDQPMVPQPSFTWSLDSGLGTISPTGVFTASGSGSGLATIQVSADGFTSSVSLEVGIRVVIDFDNLSVGTVITDQYPLVTFSGDPSFPNKIVGYSEASSPNSIGAPTPPPDGDGVGNPYTHPLYVDFAIPANGLRFQQFHDDAGMGSVIGQVRVFEDGTPSDVASMISQTSTVDLSSYHNVTRIEIANVTDPAGLVYDDFSFLSSLEVESSGDEDVTADDPHAFPVVSVSFGADGDGGPIYADDGTVVQWRVEGTGGTLEATQTNTEDGLASNMLTTTTTAGDTFKVYAKVTALAIAGGPARPIDGPEVLVSTVTVHPGKASNVVLDVQDSRLPSDGTSTTQITLTARDAAGNLVEDGTDVEWSASWLDASLAADGSLENEETTTEAGQASVDFHSGLHRGTQRISATIDGVEAHADVESIPVVITLGATGNALEVGTSQTSTITATFADADGNPVANGTPVTWYTQKGTIAGDSSVQGGVAGATLFASGGAQTVGQNVFTASVGGSVGASTQLSFFVPNSRLFIQLEHAVLAGDAAVNGQLDVEQFSGGTQSYSYYAETQGKVVHGPPGATVRVTLGSLDAPNGGGLVINGQTGPVDLVLDANGQAAFTINSTGALVDPNSVGYALPIHAEVVQGWWEWLTGAVPTVADSRVVVEKAAAWAGTVDYLNQVKQFGWGAVWGDGDGVAGAAGDLTASVTPIVGVFADGRDVLKEVAKLWPGGDDPDWAVAGFAAVGLAGELPWFKAADWAPAALKVLSKVLKRGGALRAAVNDMFMRAVKLADLSELTKYKDVLLKLVADLDFRKLADETLVASKDGFAQFTKLSDALGLDTAADLLKRTASDFSPEKAQALQKSLSRASADQLAVLKNADKLDVVAKGVGKGDWAINDTVKYADQVRDLGGNSDIIKSFDDFADVPGSGRMVYQLNAPDVGTKNTLVVAQLRGKQNIEQLSVPLTDANGKFVPAGPGQKIITDIDVVTVTEAIEVKTDINNKNYSKIYSQLKKLATWAKDNGKDPVLAVPNDVGELKSTVNTAINNIKNELGVNFSILRF